MSEVQPRTGGTRGRGGFRGGRGGFRGGRTGSRHQRSDEQENVPPTAIEEQGEVGELKKQFGDKIPLLREIYSGWSDEDLVFALQETNGDVEATVDRISSGTISQWGEVKKKQPKTKDATPSGADSGTTRGRGRGTFEGRGRGRGVERGARAGRGARAVSQTNGTKPANKSSDDWGTPAPTTETTTNGDTPVTSDWANEPGKDALSSLETDEAKPASAAAPAAKKGGGWAGLFAKPAPVPKPAPVAAPIPTAQPEEAPADPAPVAEEPITTQPIQPPPIESILVDDGPVDLPSAPHSDTAGDLAPSKDELTETNLEQLPDTSHPPVSATAASTVASTVDPLTQSEAPRPAIRPGMSGYAASALKATSGVGRSASFTRKIMEQQEAVVMPGNHAIEKAAVQFGKMGLNDGDDVDVDEDREEPETRTQLPDDSPAAPRASLPPSILETQEAAPEPTQAPVEAPQAPRQAPGLPPAPQQPAHASPPSAPSYTDQYRYGQGQKTYDPFGQQPQQTQAQAQSQEPFSNQVPNQSQAGPGSAQNDYSAYYGRDAYQNYYGAYGHGQETQRSGSAFGTSSQETQGQYATTRPQAGYGHQETQNSGNNTPNPTVPAQQAQHSQHMPGQGGHGGYPYGYPSSYSQQYPQQYQNYMNQMNHRYGANRPMFDDVRRQENEYYNSQYGYGHNQQQYGGNYKSGMYGQPYSYEHSSSPANTGAFAGREGMYGRTGSAQPSEAQQSGTSGGNAFGGMPDPFGRSSSGFGQSQTMPQQHSGHQASEEAGKGTGPSPSMQGGRPGSTVNSAPGHQSGLPPPQSQHSAQQAFGGYPQYGAGLGGLGAHQSSHQNTGYGGYGSNAFGSYGAYGSGGGRGWNGNSYGATH